MEIGLGKVDNRIVHTNTNDVKNPSINCEQFAEHIRAILKQKRIVVITTDAFRDMAGLESDPDNSEIDEFANAFGFRAGHIDCEIRHTFEPLERPNDFADWRVCDVTRTKLTLMEKEKGRNLYRQSRLTKAAIPASS